MEELYQVWKKNLILHQGKLNVLVLYGGLMSYNETSLLGFFLAVISLLLLFNLKLLSYCEITCMNY